jgi:hypothetical protein
MNFAGKPDGSRPFTQRQRDIELILSSYEQLFLGAEPPAIKHVCGWLACADVSGVLAAMEKAFERDQIEPLHSIQNHVYSLLKKRQGSQSPVDTQSTAIYFDEQGRRI